MDAALPQQPGYLNPQQRFHRLNTAIEKELQADWFELADVVEPFELFVCSLLITGLCIFSRLGMYASLVRMRCIDICRVSCFGSTRDYLLSGI